VHASYILRTDEYAKDAGEVVFAESGNLPSWADCEKDFWSASDEHERQNGRVYREIEFALPRELTEQEQIALAKDFARDVTWEHGLPYTLAIHQGRGSNPHAHLMLCERGYDGHERSREQFFKRANGSEPARGGAAKIKALTKREWVSQVRETWTINANVALEHKRVPERIDHRSYANQGVDTIPQMHLGRPATQAMRRGDAHPRLERYKAIQAERERVEPMRDVAKPAPALARARTEVKERKEQRDGGRLEATRDSADERGGAPERSPGSGGGPGRADKEVRGGPGIGDEVEHTPPDVAGRPDPKVGAARVELEADERGVERGRVGSKGHDREVSPAPGRVGEEEPSVGRDHGQGQQAARGAQSALDRDPYAGGVGRGSALDQGARTRGTERREHRTGKGREVLPETDKYAGRGRDRKTLREAEQAGRDSGAGVRSRAQDDSVSSQPKEEVSKGGLDRVLEALEESRRRREAHRARSKAMRERPLADRRSEEQKRYDAQIQARAEAVLARRAQEKAEQERLRLEQERAREQARQDAERQREAARRREQERAKQPTLDGYKESLSKTGIRLETLEPSQRAFGVVRGEVPTRDGSYLVLETDPKKHPDGPDYVAIEKTLFTRSTWPEKGDSLEVYRSSSRFYVHDRDHDLDMDR